MNSVYKSKRIIWVKMITFSSLIPWIYTFKSAYLKAYYFFKKYTRLE